MDRLKTRAKVKRWAKWSLEHNHTEEEIRNQILDNPDLVCFAFLFENSHISSEFKKELEVLSIFNPITNKPFLNRSNYDALYNRLNKIYRNVKYNNKYKTDKKTRLLVSNLDFLKLRYDTTLIAYKKMIKKPNPKPEEITKMTLRKQRNEEMLRDADNFIRTGEFDRSSLFFKFLDNNLSNRLPESAEI